MNDINKVDNQSNELRDRKEELELRRNKIEGTINSFKVFYWIIIVALIIAGILAVNIYNTPIRFTLTILVSFALYFTIFPIMNLLMGRTNRIDAQILELEEEMDLLRIGDESLEKRAEKQFRIHQGELKRYYDQSLNQSKWIFWVGILSIVAGIGVILITLILIFNNPSSNSEIIIAVTGGGAGILSNFVGVIFLKMYSESVKSLNTFHERLVTTHHLHFSNFLISKIFNENLREETWAELALSLTKDNNAKSLEKANDTE